VVKGLADSSFCLAEKVLFPRSPNQGASALMALPLLLFLRSRDHLVRGSSHAWRYSRVANTPNSNRDAAAVDILNIFYVPIRSKTFCTYGTLIYFIKKIN